MTEDQARKLAARIIDTWPGGARAYVWRDVLLPLDNHAADVTYRILTREQTAPPTPGLFVSAYRAQRARLMAPAQLSLAEPDAPTLGLREYLATHPGAPTAMHPKARPVPPKESR